MGILDPVPGTCVPRMSTTRGISLHCQGCQLYIKVLTHVVEVQKLSFPHLHSVGQPEIRPPAPGSWQLVRLEKEVQ